MEYKRGDYVKLFPKDHESFNREYDYLSVVHIKTYSILSANCIVEVLITTTDGRFTARNDEHNAVYHEAMVERKCTQEEIDEIFEKERIKKEKKEEERIEKLKNFVYKGEDVAKIANEIFGEERVDNGSSYICIHFPEITITNSLGHKHLVRDLYIHINILYDEFVRNNRSSIDIEIMGIRRTLSIREFDSGYSHSHLDGGIDDWGHFCMGVSPFATLVTEVGMNPIADNWEMLLMSLENFLSWESLEGGPFIKIENIGNTRGIDSLYNNIFDETIRLLPTMPKEIFEHSSNGIKLIRNASTLKDFLNVHSTVRILNHYTKEETEEMIAEGWDSVNLGFKNKQIPVVMYNDQEMVVQDYISPEIVRVFEDNIENKLKEFNRNIVYDQYKKRNQRTVRMAGTIKQANNSNNKEVTKADRLLTPQGG